MRCLFFFINVLLHNTGCKTTFNYLSLMDWAPSFQNRSSFLVVNFLMPCKFCLRPNRMDICNGTNPRKSSALRREFSGSSKILMRMRMSSKLSRTPRELMSIVSFSIHSWKEQGPLEHSSIFPAGRWKLSFLCLLYLGVCKCYSSSIALNPLAF